MEGIPKTYRHEASYTVSDGLAPKLKPSKELEALAILSHAMRYFAGEELRALLLYSTDVNDAPADRDAAYIAVLTAVIVEALLAPEFNQKHLHHNLLAVVVLEETMVIFL